MDIRFAYRLVTSPYYQLEYEDAKAGPAATKALLPLGLAA
jgi:hypothetical protein